MIGLTIGQYRVLRHFDGDTGDTFVAQDLKKGRDVVLKFLPSALASQPAGLARVERAARALTELTSPGRQTFQGLERTEDRAFLVLDPENAAQVLRELHELGRHLSTTEPARRPDAAVTSTALGTVDAATLADFDPTLTSPKGELAAGRMLGTRYRLIQELGSGGMGVVWHAFDLKLQVEVALKALRRDRFPDDASFELLRREVRAGREVISPNVCRIYDLVEQESQEYLSMEYVDGVTLIDYLRERGPLDARAAGPIVSQLLAGLEAIHNAEFIHRDIKPENVMITRTGRVVLMDFGIAQAFSRHDEDAAAGTLPYMAPEILCGEPPDVRADLYAIGVVLAEMIAPHGVADHAQREQLWHAVRDDPPEVPDGPWKSILQRALAAEPEQRFATSRELARALESVTPLVVGADDKTPYPGLQAFSAAEAQYFYGREGEVEALWKRLQRSQLLAVIGASGSGKSSFLRAGVVPTRPDGWGFVLCHPGTNPFLSFARALAPELGHDGDTVDTLLQFENPDQALPLVQRWRGTHTEALVIVDQFEELFTQCNDDMRARFVWLLRRLALDADVRVLLSMRDDFLIQCQEHPLLAPIFAELTPLGSLSGNALRRALVQPALTCGYRFEDEELIEEILDDVRGERGALPLLAFAMSRLWERRDRETGRLTRAAYDELGRVHGALAQHAEATLEHIGASRHGIVREIFRNLVTAEGTRAALTTDELMSVFAGAGPEKSGAAQDVLRSLVDARLLTSYEESIPDEGGGQETHHRIEVVHESLFQSWPRLVRWRTQDAAGAQLRDQLRHAAQVWSSRGRTDDLLWTGKTFREYLVWRDDYAGGLTATEEAFAKAMVRRADRQRRRRRQLLVASFAVLVGVIGVVSFSLVRSIREGRRAQANEFFRQGQRLPERYASQRLACAIEALELRDDPEIRRFALRTLWQGPIARVTHERGSFSADFTSDGKHLVSSPFGKPVQVWSSVGGGPTLVQDSLVTMGEGYSQFVNDRSMVLGYQDQHDGTLRFWSFPDWQEAATLHFDGLTLVDLSPNRQYMVSRTDIEDDAENETTLLQVWSLTESQPRHLGSRSVARIPPGGRTDFHASDFTSVDNAGTRVLFASGPFLEMLPVAGFETVAPIRVGQHDAEIDGVAFHPDGDRALSVDSNGEIRMWSTREITGEPLRTFQGQNKIIVGFQFDPTGTLFGAPSRSGSVEIWDLSAPPSQEPLYLGLPGSAMSAIDFHPSGRWIATAHVNGRLAFWYVDRSFPRVIQTKEPVSDIAISPNGEWIASAASNGVRLWSLNADGTLDGRKLTDRHTQRIAWDPQGRFLAVRGLGWRGIGILSLADGSISEFGGAPSSTEIWNNFNALGVSPSGRFVAVEWVSLNRTEDARIHVHDRVSGDERVLRTEQYTGLAPLIFVSETELIYDIRCRTYLWDISEDTNVELDFSGGIRELSRDESRAFLHCQRKVRVHDRATGQTREVRELDGSASAGAAFDPNGAFYAVGLESGDVLFGKMDGSEPHLLPGHEGQVNRVRVDPNGRWIVSAGADGTIRTWPIPEGRPLHTLSRRELLEVLRSHTNLRVVADPDSRTGVRLDTAPFEGWEESPRW